MMSICRVASAHTMNKAHPAVYLLTITCAQECCKNADGDLKASHGKKRE